MSDSNAPQVTTTKPIDPTPVLNAIAANWWVLLLRGILLLVIGLYALFNPGLTLLTWAFVVGCFLMADGILAIAAGIAGWTESRGWTILRGAVAIIAGAFAAGHPALFGALAAITVIMVIAAMAVVSGVLEIIVAIRERNAIEGGGWMILDGVFSVLFGIALALVPLFSASVLIRISGVIAVLFGLVAIYCSFRIRSLKNN
ncbi:HdeD family acid-resistance protein [Neorhodopirellula lusitana]|uniref:HdeD family acid-resistance protein n=1 Tax=Neorhodopirellula lusitana TaxID=445327 RepID=UPI00384B2D6B